jgi:Zn-dependent peptidase ImmA (M78 family)
MKHIIANRIKAARTLAGLSYRELADKLQPPVSHNLLSRYEKQEITPGSDMLLALGKALNVKTDYFFMPFDLAIEKIEFRKKSKLPAKEEASIKQQVTDHIARYLEIEQFLQISSGFNNPLHARCIENAEQAETAAEALIEAWGLGRNGIPHVYEMLEDNEIKLYEMDAAPAFDGLSGHANGVIPVIVVNKNFPTERKRFTALHELAHLVLKFPQTMEQQQMEKLCHRFAAALLLPQQTLFRELGHKRSSVMPIELIPIKENYGISMAAIMARARQLDIVSDYTFRQFCIWLNKDPDRKKEIGLGHYSVEERSDRFRQLVYRAASEEVISLSKAASLCNQKLADFREAFLQV